MLRQPKQIPVSTPPKTLYLLINMSSATRRLAEAKQQLDSQGIDWERLDAITPEHPDFKRPNTKKSWYRPLTDPEIACYLSHRKAWQYALGKEADYVVILEDDLVIDHPLVPVVNAAIRLDREWDIIKLFGTRKQRKIIEPLVEKPTSVHLVDTPTVPFATTALILKTTALPALLKSSESFFRPVDIDMKHYWEKNLTIYSTYPPPVSISEENESQIGERQNKLALIPRLRKHLYNIGHGINSKFRYYLRILK